MESSLSSSIDVTVRMLQRIADYVHLLAILYLLVKIWTSRNCAGISRKSQLLYILAFGAEHFFLFTTAISTGNFDIFTIYIKYAVEIIIHFILRCLIIFTIFLIFRKTYEKKYDTFRIELPLIAYLLIAYFVQILGDPWTFGFYVESLAMMPQYYFISKAGYVHKHVSLYIHVLGFCDFLKVVSLALFYYATGDFQGLFAASILLQFLLYCYFLFRILPRLQSKPSSEGHEDQISNISLAADEMESGISEKDGHLGSNINSVVLTPASVTCNNGAKEILSKEETATNNQI